MSTYAPARERLVPEPRRHGPVELVARGGGGPGAARGGEV